MAEDQVTGVFVGVDSGGTRTNVRVVTNDDARTIRRDSTYEVSASLSGALAQDLVPSVLRTILGPLETQINEADRALRIYVWIGAAGFTPWTRDTYIDALEGLRPSILDSRITSIGVGNDAVSLLLGQRADGIIIAGTGSSVIVRPSPCELFLAGGNEWVCSDYGSGFWIGLMAIREAYRNFEDGEQSVLLQRMREVYGLRAKDDRGLVAKLRDLAVGDENIKKEIAKFTAGVCSAAERGDTAAQNIIKAEAEELADVTAKSLRRRFTTERLLAGLRLVQCGSLLNNEFYRASFEAQLNMRLLVGAERKVSFHWHRVLTAGDATAQLARDLASDDRAHLELDRAFRPVILDA